MGSTFLIWYKRIMILCLAGGVVGLIYIGVTYFGGEPMAGKLLRGLWLSVIAIMVASSSLWKMRQLSRFFTKPE